MFSVNHNNNSVSVTSIKKKSNHHVPTPTRHVRLINSEQACSSAVKPSNAYTSSSGMQADIDWFSGVELSCDTWCSLTLAGQPTPNRSDIEWLYRLHTWISIMSHERGPPFARHHIIKYLSLLIKLLGSWRSWGIKFVSISICKRNEGTRIKMACQIWEIKSGPSKV